jgi:hypothetical protein
VRVKERPRFDQATVKDLEALFFARLTRRAPGEKNGLCGDTPSRWETMTASTRGVAAEGGAPSAATNGSCTPPLAVKFVEALQAVAEERRKYDHGEQELVQEPYGTRQRSTRVSTRSSIPRALLVGSGAPTYSTSALANQEKENNPSAVAPKVSRPKNARMATKSIGRKTKAPKMRASSRLSCEGSTQVVAGSS